MCGCSSIRSSAWRSWRPGPTPSIRCASATSMRACGARRAARCPRAASAQGRPPPSPPSSRSRASPTWPSPSTSSPRGARPIVGGWTAAGGALGPAVAVLFWILFLWQLPHFLALAWIYREDYRRGGLAMLSVADPDGRRTGRMVLLYAVALLPVSLVPTLLGITGALYFYGALALGLGYAGAAVALTLAVTTPRAWRVFLVSIVYLPALLTLMVL